MRRLSVRIVASLPVATSLRFAAAGTAGADEVALLGFDGVGRWTADGRRCRFDLPMGAWSLARPAFPTQTLLP